MPVYTLKNIRDLSKLRVQSPGWWQVHLDSSNSSNYQLVSSAHGNDGLQVTYNGTRISCGNFENCCTDLLTFIQNLFVVKQATDDQPMHLTCNMSNEVVQDLACQDNTPASWTSWINTLTACGVACSIALPACWRVTRNLFGCQMHTGYTHAETVTFMYYHENFVERELAQLLAPQTAKFERSHDKCMRCCKRTFPCQSYWFRFKSNGRGNWIALYPGGGTTNEFTLTYYNGDEAAEAQEIYKFTVEIDTEKDSRYVTMANDATHGEIPIRMNFLNKDLLITPLACTYEIDVGPDFRNKRVKIRKKLLRLGKEDEERFIYGYNGGSTMAMLEIGERQHNGIWEIEQFLIVAHASTNLDPETIAEDHLPAVSGGTQPHEYDPKVLPAKVLVVDLRKKLLISSNDNTVRRCRVIEGKDAYIEECREQCACANHSAPGASEYLNKLKDKTLQKAYREQIAAAMQAESEQKQIVKSSSLPPSIPFIYRPVVYRRASYTGAVDVKYDENNNEHKHHVDNNEDEHHVDNKEDKHHVDNNEDEHHVHNNEDEHHVDNNEHKHQVDNNEHKHQVDNNEDEHQVDNNEDEHQVNNVGGQHRHVVIDIKENEKSEQSKTENQNIIRQRRKQKLYY